MTNLTGVRYADTVRAGDSREWHATHAGRLTHRTGMQAVAHAGGVTHRNGMRARDSLQWHVTHAGRLTHRNGMRAPGGDQGKLGCLPTVPIGVTGCKLGPCCH